MRLAKVLYKDEEAGTITQNDDGNFSFNYYEGWISNSDKPAISPTLPKSVQTFQSKFLFPFFYNMLPEGVNKQIICKLNRIDTNDDFGLLMATARYDSIGAVRVISEEEI